jgi:hypothetical protein
MFVVFVVFFEKEENKEGNERERVHAWRERTGRREKGRRCVDGREGEGGAAVVVVFEGRKERNERERQIKRVPVW